jgi:hypothetical protein
VLVYSSIEITPLATDFDVGFIDPDRAAMGASKLPKSLFDLRRVSENPAVHRAVIDLEAAFKEHALEITIAQRIAQIPCHRLHDQPRLEMTPLEIVLGLTFQFLGNRVQNHWLAPQFREQNPTPL